MASKADRTAILLSIKPQYAEAILEGRKLVEFRRSNICSLNLPIYLYSTSPTRGIVGKFFPKKISRLSISDLWKSFGNLSGIQKSDFDKYFDNALFGYAITVDRYIKFIRPLKLKDISSKISPPRSFRYLTKKDVLKIERKVSK